MVVEVVFFYNPRYWIFNWWDLANFYCTYINRNLANI